MGKVWKGHIYVLFFSTYPLLSLCCRIAGILIELQTLLSVGLSPAKVKQLSDDFDRWSLILGNADLENGTVHNLITYHFILCIPVRGNCLTVSLKCSEGQPFQTWLWCWCLHKMGENEQIFHSQENITKHKFHSNNWISLDVCALFLPSSQIW